MKPWSTLSLAAHGGLNGECELDIHVQGSASVGGI